MVARTPGGGPALGGSAPVVTVARLRAGCYHGPAVTRDRLALLVTSSALLMSWLSAPATPTPAPASAPAAVIQQPQPDATTSLAFDVERETDKLRERVSSAPAPRRPGRDPFRFATDLPREVPMARADAAPWPDAATPAPEPPPAPRPSFKLIGIAERNTPDGLVRTGILSGQSDVFLVSVGDEILGRYSVSAVGVDAVELLDAASGQPLVLALPVDGGAVPR